MKRILTVFFCFLLFFSFTACTSGAGQNFAEALVDRQEQIHSNAEQPQPVEIQEYDSPNFSDSLGFIVTEYPNNSSISATKFFVLDGWYAQLQFTTADGLYLVLRVAKEDAGYLTNTYKELHTAGDTVRIVNDLQVRTRNSDQGCSMVTWEQDGFQYLLHSNKGQGPLPGNIVDAMVTGLRCQSA